MVLLGNGRLRGALTQPDFLADFTVVNGTLRLPAAKVALQPGGTFGLTYAGDSGHPNASAVANIEGHTYLTAAPYGDVPERYYITLGINGDVLADNGATLSARADPPDISQERILALLGEGPLLKSNPSETASDQMREAFAGFAVPAALDPLTGKIAAGLGLDYLSVDYNQYDLATVDFARALNSQFVVEGRRQLGTPQIGTKPISDIQLSYHLPAKHGALRQVSIAVGADQDNAWKIKASYGTRF
jgi:hypothetical protein